MTENDELKIIELVKAGDSDAFCELVDEYKEKAISIAYSYCSNFEDAKDLSQEAFIKAFKMIDRFKARSRFYTWYYRILVNICLDFLRRRKKKYDKMLFHRRIEDREQDRSADIFENVASSFPDPKRALMNSELGEKLTDAINSLPDKQKAVFVLKNIHGSAIEEIAEITGTALGTVKANLFKATVNLQRKLKKYVI